MYVMWALGAASTGGMVCVIFLFQAEDGIRDRLVTGVQTCALPICFLRSTFLEFFPFFAHSAFSTVFSRMAAFDSS